MNTQYKHGVSYVLVLTVIALILVFAGVGYVLYYSIYSDTTTVDKFDKYDEMAQILAAEAELYKRNKATAQEIVLSFNEEDRDIVANLHKNPEYAKDGVRTYDLEIATYKQLLAADKELPLEEESWLKQRLGTAYISKNVYSRDDEALRQTKEGYALLKEVALEETYPKVVRADAVRVIADAMLVDMNIDLAVSDVFTGPLFGEIIANYDDPTSMKAVMLSCGDLYRYSAYLYKERSEERRVGKECRSRLSPYH